MIDKIIEKYDLLNKVGNFVLYEKNELTYKVKIDNISLYITVLPLKNDYLGKKEPVALLNKVGIMGIVVFENDKIIERYQLQ